VFDFTVIECDQFLIQALVNCAATALLQTKFQLKCIPTAVCILLNNRPEASETALLDKIKIDPCLKEVSEMRRSYSHNLVVVCDSQSDEILLTEL